MDPRLSGAAPPARVIAIAVAFGLATDVLLRGHALGVNLLLLTAALLLAAAAIRPPGRPMDRLDAWLPVAAVTFAAFPALRTDQALIVVDTLAATILAGATIAAAAGAAVTRRSLLAGLGLAGKVALFVVGGAIEVIGRFRATTQLGSIAAHQRRRLLPVARGLLIGLPLLAAFTVLFALADPIFERGLSEVAAWQPPLGDLPARILVICSVAWIAAGLLWLVASGATAVEIRSLGAAAVSPTIAWPRLGLTEALTILLALDVLFGLFAAVQVAFLFGGLDTITAIGLTYAEYARRGFFELLLVGFLAGAVIGGMEATAGERPRRFVAALLGLVLLTGVVIGSSFVRLRFYQEAYGWTELRFWVMASIGFLALCVAGAAMLVAADRSRWLPHAVAASGVATLLAINLLGPQGFVTDRNLERAINPALIPPDGEPALDATYLGRLDADAVPALVRALPSLPEPGRGLIFESLREFRVRLEAEAPAGDVAAWNLARERARAALGGLPEQ